MAAESKRKRGNGPVESRNYGLSEEARKTLKAHAAEWCIPESVVLDYLCCTHLRAVRIVPWGKAPREEAGVSGSADEKEPVPVLPIAEGGTPPLGSPPAVLPGQGRGQSRKGRAAG